jgi:glycosyltransferase involved in cell wall biosynthesis
MIWILIAGLRFRPDVYMGYHLFPGAVTALLAARVFGRPCCYQMTGGPIEIVGGGYQSENRLTRLLASPSPRLERLALKVVKEFELVVVRGEGAKRFLQGRGCNGTVEIITGSIPTIQGRPFEQRQYDLIFVGRLAPIKQPEQFVEVVARLAPDFSSLRAVVVGDGPELAALRRQAARLGVEGHIDFAGQREEVVSLLTASKVFVLTSRSEGLSIALVEAMGAGAPAVVADVGDLSDLVHHGENGYLAPPNDINAYVTHVRSILRDPVLWARLSDKASEAAHRRHSVGAVAARWGQCLSQLVRGEAAPTTEPSV